jgi:type II secretory ATPase GspE/PulE/Tfp pilus assembly ATPase PilB-like protein
VVNVRLVRKLCETCKEAYPPPAEVLKQMGLPAGRIESFYRPPTKPIDPKHPEKVCEVCQGIGYRGRTGIFELLVVDDLMRSVLGSQPKLDALRDAARKSKHRALQEEGLLLVAKGVTSLQELLRVLKQ